MSPKIPAQSIWIFSNPELLEKYNKELEKRGFKMSDKDKKTIYNDNYIIDDLHEDNIFIDKEGNFFFIDTVPALNTAEDDFGGTREYGNGEIIRTLDMGNHLFLIMWTL
jgi:hypothetical protein